MKKWIPLIIIIILAALVFLVTSISGNKVTANELSQAYVNNPAEASEEFTNNEITVTGKVRAFYMLLGTREVLELEITSDLPVICFFFTDESIYNARQFKQQQEVVVKGICVGTDTYSFVRGVKIEVDEIEAD